MICEHLVCLWYESFNAYLDTQNLQSANYKTQLNSTTWLQDTLLWIMRNQLIKHQHPMNHKESPDIASTTNESWGITDIASITYESWGIKDIVLTTYESRGISRYSITAYESWLLQQPMQHEESANLSSTTYEPGEINRNNIDSESGGISRYSINNLRNMRNHRLLISHHSLVAHENIFSLFRCSGCPMSWPFTNAKMYIFLIACGSNDIT